MKGYVVEQLLILTLDASNFILAIVLVAMGLVIIFGWTFFAEYRKKHPCSSGHLHENKRERESCEAKTAFERMKPDLINYSPHD